MKRGWLADWDDDQASYADSKYAWRPMLQIDGMTVTCDGPWFATEAECERFIRDEIIGRRMWSES